VDAFRFDPLGYLQAVGWRARGLRVRSRHRIAALAGRSPHAYALYMASEEPEAFAALPLAEPSGDLSILPVIDCRSGYGGLDATIASISRAGCQLRPVLIGGPPISETVRVDEPKEIGRLVGGEIWLCCLQPGDQLAPDALAAYAGAAAHTSNAWLIYGDDDLLDASGRRRAPHFKPDWNPDLFEHHDFVTGASIVKSVPGALARLPAEGWGEALVRQAIGRGERPVHLQHVLHHRRERPRPVLPAKPLRLVAKDSPTVTAIVPTRNNLILLRNCIEGLSRADYPRLDVIVVDNESDDPETLAYLDRLKGEGFLVQKHSGPFNFSALNNAAVEHARGEYLCFLNNDIEMIDADWLGLLMRQAVRPEVGAVGARLLYPDRTVQHAGVFIGIGGGAGHGHKFQTEDDPGYFERARLPQQVSAVTAACLVVSREKFLAVGGFDEENFPVAFNDVDLCLKLNSRGWQALYEPRATLIHHESKSRGKDSAKANRARFAGELAALKRKWHTDQHRDPYHHPQLSPFCEQFLIAV